MDRGFSLDFFKTNEWITLFISHNLLTSFIFLFFLIIITLTHDNRIKKFIRWQMHNRFSLFNNPRSVIIFVLFFRETDTIKVYRL